MFGVIGIFILGFIFGALAILNAGSAEAHGVPATFGKPPAGSSPCCLFIWLLLIIVMVIRALATWRHNSELLNTRRSQSSPRTFSAYLAGEARGCVRATGSE
jgi:hypothetical protein